MFIFTGALLLYAGLMALTRDYNLVPFRARQSVKPKHPKEYMLQLSKIVALAALAVAALWAGTKIIQKAL